MRTFFFPAMQIEPDRRDIQKDSPVKAKEPNWLPALNGTIYLAMRLYWPKDTPPSILPARQRNVEAHGRCPN